MSDYEDTTQRNSQRAILVRESKSPTPRTFQPLKPARLPKKEEV
jgi:hypothetical protein